MTRRHNERLKRKPANTRLIKFYNKRARQWGENYMKRHFWRIRAMYDFEDLKQDAFAVYLGVYRRHPKCSENDLLRIYRCALWGRVNNRSRQCFPNPYAYEKGKGKLVVNIDECTFTHFVEHELAFTLDGLSDVLEKLPEELAGVLKLLIRDFVGVSCIEQRRVKRLLGPTRLEPLGVALARTAKLDPSRDLFEELSEAFNAQQPIREYSENVDRERATGSGKTKEGSEEERKGARLFQAHLGRDR